MQSIKNNRKRNITIEDFYTTRHPQKNNVSHNIRTEQSAAKDESIKRVQYTYAGK